MRKTEGGTAEGAVGGMHEVDVLGCLGEGMRGSWAYGLEDTLDAAASVDRDGAQQQHGGQCVLHPRKVAPERHDGRRWPPRWRQGEARERVGPRDCRGYKVLIKRMRLEPMSPPGWQDRVHCQA